MKDLERLLSDGELHELDESLADPALVETSMDVSTLEGFFTALAIGPDTLMPSQWLPWVYDMREGKAEAEFENLEQANRILGLLMRHHNTVIHAFMDDPPRSSRSTGAAPSGARPNGARVFCSVCGSATRHGVC